MIEIPRHGADPRNLALMLGVQLDPAAKIIDFSTNTNVVSWDGDMSVDPSTFMTYPDTDCCEIRKILASQNKCAEDDLLITNGSNEAVYLLASLYAGSSACYNDPIYGEYRRACTAFGIKDAGREHGAINFICNPCNPTGEYMAPDVIETTAREDPDRLFVIDEAYVDLMQTDHRELDIKRHKNLVILRSLTKLFHLCGARIGYVMADHVLIQKMRERQPSWSVNGPAQALCARFLVDPDFKERTRRYYAAETPRFIAKLREMGLRIKDTVTNFFLVYTKDDAKVMSELMRRGIAVRHTRNFIGLDGSMIRLATRTPEENQAFIDAIADIDSAKRHEIF